jgi:hypothetical protein
MPPQNSGTESIGDPMSPDAKIIVVVQDNLSTQMLATRYEALPAPRSPQSRHPNWAPSARNASAGRWNGQADFDID